MTIKKLFKKLIFVILVLIALIFTLNYIVVSNSKNYIYGDSETPAEGKKYDCILILGASVKPDKQPSSMLKDRLDKGIKLYRDDFAPKILMSGDNGQVEYNEVEIMKNYAIEQGVPEEDIFLDHAGFSTYESMYRAKEVFVVKKVLIVTQRYHEYRAVYTARRLGLEAEGASCREIRYGGQSYRDLREILARDKDFLKCIFKPQSTYLGEVIDIHGDGRKSH